jgi:hypothetical protein
MSLTVVCLWVHFPDSRDHKRHYSADYVKNLFGMVSRNIDRPFKMVCLTNVPKMLPKSIRTIKVPPLLNKHGFRVRGWWNKVHLFDPRHDFGSDRVLYLDLDLLIVDRLEPIVDFPAPFAISTDIAPLFQGGKGLTVCKRYNSSIMVWDREARPTELYTEWKPEIAARLWGDQDWIGERLPDLARFPKEWMKRHSTNPEKVPPFPGVKVVTCTKFKNHECVTMPGQEWVRKVWYGGTPSIANHKD